MKKYQYNNSAVIACWQRSYAELVVATDTNYSRPVIASLSSRCPGVLSLALKLVVDCGATMGTYSTAARNPQKKTQDALTLYPLYRILLYVG